MRASLMIIAAIALGGCSAVQPETASPSLAAQRPANAEDQAAIAALEADWSRAFLAKDYARIEEIVAPEFKLLGWRDGELGTTNRQVWMANTRRFDFKVYETTLLDVVVVDDTAVATVAGNWTIGMGDRVRPNSRFLVTDTWVRRDGRWQVILRNAQTLD